MIVVCLVSDFNGNASNILPLIMIFFPLGFMLNILYPKGEFSSMSSLLNFCNMELWSLGLSF